ncbi:hypothetical protein VIAG107301_18205 [Vibrio agarivorans]
MMVDIRMNKSVVLEPVLGSDVSLIVTVCHKIASYACAFVLTSRAVFVQAAFLSLDGTLAPRPARFTTASYSV